MNLSGMTLSFLTDCDQGDNLQSYRPLPSGKTIKKFMFNQFVFAQVTRNLIKDNVLPLEPIKEEQDHDIPNTDFS